MQTSQKGFAIYLGKDNGIKLGRDYGTINLYVVSITDQDAIRNPADDSGLRDLHISAQWDIGTVEQRTYAWSARFEDVYSIGLGEAQRMAKTLKRVAAVEHKFPVQPETFGQYVQMLCAGLGIKYLAQLQEYRGSSYSDNVHRIAPIKDAQFVIDNLIKQAQLEYQITR